MYGSPSVNIQGLSKNGTYLPGQNPNAVDVQALLSRPILPGETHRHPVLIVSSVTGTVSPSDIPRGVNPSQTTIVPLKPNEYEHLMSSREAQTPVSGSWWKWNVHWTNPSALFHELWSILRDSGAYVVWNFEDLRAQIMQWDGTMWGLMHHMGLIWRVMITAILLVGITQAGPLLDAMVRLFQLLFDVVSTVVTITWGVVEEMWSVVERIFSTIENWLE